MHVLYMLLYILSAVCLFLGFLSTRRRVGGVDALSFVCLGLLFWVLVPTIQTIVRLN